MKTKLTAVLQIEQRAGYGYRAVMILSPTLCVAITPWYGLLPSLQMQLIKRFKITSNQVFKLIEELEKCKI